ncbi:MAG TPA: hypothetical protein VKU60_14915, partial [Chloroflexota bacterium]|nr:hypothetical protein [Chloroflexota bacterium]
PPTLLSLLLVLALAPGAAAQAAGSDYTASMPSVAKIKAQLQGTDPIDTAARQAAIFEYLPIYIQRIKETRDYRGPYSPGEQKLLTDYAQALYAIQQDMKKNHSPAELQRFNGLEGQYSINNAETWIKQLSGSQANDTYKGAQQSLSQTYNQHEAQMQKQMQQDNGQDDFMAGLRGGGNVQLKPDQKRCLELGGTMNQCANAIIGLATGMGNFLTAMMGGGNDTPPPPPLTGVLLVGSYHSRTDLPEVALNPGGGALVKKCGTLVDATHGYTLRKSAGTVQLALENEPDPIVLTLRPDGSLAGPGNIQVKGSVITGYHNVTSCVHGNCSTTSTPLYAASMQRCTVSQLAPQPAPPPPPKPKPGSIQDLAGVGDPVATIYGFRVTGPYASSSGMKLDFGNAWVTLDCGQAHVNAPYTVDNTASGFIVHVQNGGGAFLLGVAPDNTLRGSGSTTVNGKLVSGVNGEVVSFTPHSESCSVGTFAPQSNQNTMVATGGPVVYGGPAPALPGSEPEPAEKPANATAAAPAARAAFRVLLSSTFSGANPLAGQAVFVSRKPMDQILRELGVAVPAQATPGQAMKALQTQCHSAQGCSSVIQGMAKYYVTTTKLDTSGKATLTATAATGPYYFFAIVPNSGGGSLLWDVLANLAAGDNKVTFTQANSERVN